MERSKAAQKSPSPTSEQVKAANLPQRSVQSKQSQALKNAQELQRKQLAEATEKSKHARTKEDTSSTLASSAPNSPKAQPRCLPYLDPDTSSDFDKGKVDILQQQLDIGKLFQGTGNELEDHSIVIEDRHIVFRGARYNFIKSVRIHGQQFANKIIWTSDQQGQDSYDVEVYVLKILRQRPNWHVVYLVCHYVRLENESCLILSPLADSNLKEYLSQDPTPGRKNIVARWFGCLAAALRHIHAQKIKHKDIKSANILVHGENIIITDLGISRRFDDNSGTSGPTWGSKMYMAPEVHKEERRGRRQDTWALLCCFIEMFAYLQGYTLPDFQQEVKHFCSFYENYEQVVEWLKSKRPDTTDECELALLEFILDSFRLDAKKRPYADELVNRLQAIDRGGSQRHIGECCIEHEGLPVDVDSGSVPMKTVSIGTDLESLEKGSLLRFVVSAGKATTKTQPCEAVEMILDDLLQGVKGGKIKSIRSAERKLLLIIAPRRCKSAGEYLSICKAFVGYLADAYASQEYAPCLYDTERGEEERAYSTNFFAVLVEEIRNRCRTYQWNSLPSSKS